MGPSCSGLLMVSLVRSRCPGEATTKGCCTGCFGMHWRQLQGLLLLPLETEHKNVSHTPGSQAKCRAVPTMARKSQRTGMVLHQPEMPSVRVICTAHFWQPYPVCVKPCRDSSSKVTTASWERESTQENIKVFRLGGETSAWSTLQL